MLQIRDDFRDLLPRLQEAELEALEESILLEGCHTPLSIWNQIIIDGHNRYEICRKHGKTYETREMNFPDEDAVREWIIKNQIGRRNLTGGEKTLYIGKLYELRRKKIGAPLENNNASKSSEFPSESGVDNVDNVTTLIPETPNSTARQIGSEVGVSERTVRRAAQISEIVRTLPEPEQQAYRDGFLSATDVVAKASRSRQTVPPENFPEGKSAATFVIQKQARRLTLALQKFEGKVKDIYSTETGIVHRIPMPLVNIDQEIHYSIKDFLVRLDELSDVYICQFCMAAGCDEEEGCEFGYVGEDTYKFQIRKLSEQALSQQAEEADELLELLSRQTT